MAEEKLTFEAEVSRLLEIVAKSLYTHKEIFLRELISNASDACDRLRYLSLTQPDLISDDPELRITITRDAEARRLTVADNGIGMNREELIENLGTVARSGTAEFVSRLTGDARKDMALVGQFGVGFYAAFMVADRVEVRTRKAGERQGWLWASDGKGGYTIAAAGGEDIPGRGTAVTLLLGEEDKEFAERERIRRIVQTYSDHIGLPIILKEDGGEEKLNTAAALWTRPKSEITPEQYREFYHHVSHSLDDPWLTLHLKAEGMIEYAALLFVPSRRPLDIFDPDRKQRVKLYVRRVFITDDCEGLLPSYLRFVRGVVDSEDLPLNISRETLQYNPLLAKIRNGLTKRLFEKLGKKAEAAPEEYATFWENFGAVLKEGLYEDPERREQILPLCRFHSTAAQEPVSLADYIGRMKDGQDAIFYITGDDIDSLRLSPQLEGFRARGLEVLLLDDPVDEFWVPAVGAHDGKAFRSVTRGDVDLEKFETEAAAAPAEAGKEAAAGGKKKKKKPREAAPEKMAALVGALKLALGDAVKDVRASQRLTDSPVCLVADEHGLDMHLERLLRQHRRIDHVSTRILEVNPRHPLIVRLADKAARGTDADDLGDIAHLLLDQARIVEGEQIPDPAGFSRRLCELLTKGLAA